LEGDRQVPRLEGPALVAPCFPASPEVDPLGTNRIEIRTATKNQLLGQLDRRFPGLTRALPDVLGTKVGRLLATEFADPARLAAL
jgi:hypothetical protein